MTFWKSIAASVLCGTLFTAVSSAQQQAPPQSPASETQPANPNAKVIFSRSQDDAALPEKQPASVAVKVTDQERASITFTSYDLDVHLALRDHSLAVLARLTLRNDGDQPLKHLPLQLSSSLNFEGVSLEGKRVAFGQQTIDSDVDHTGRLHEAVIELPMPLAHGASLSLEVAYSGLIEIDAERLEHMGTPEDVAAHSDWDRISEGFTGLRGFGNVVWYPVVSPPALFGDQARVFAQIGTQKLRQSEATVAMRLTMEFFVAAPTVALLDGHIVQVNKPTAMPTADYPGVVACALPATRLGFAVPSIFLSDNAPHQRDEITIYPRQENEAAIPNYFAAATLVRPIIQQWLGAKPRRPLVILDLPESEDASYDEGSALLTAITADPPEKLAEMLSQALAHAYFQSPREWLEEGVATFADTLWIEHIRDQQSALEKLESSRGALTFAEPGTPGAAPGEDLLHATDAVYYRTKAAYVFWMLRDLVGDKELALALENYKPADDITPEYFEHVVEQASGKDLKWFFDDWIYRDRGLPDLSIAGVYTSPHSGQYLVAVDILNDGFAEAEVPVTVRSQDATITERVRLPGKTKTAHRILIQGQPKEVIVNDGTVPEVQATIHKRTINNQ